MRATAACVSRLPPGTSAGRLDEETAPTVLGASAGRLPPALHRDNALASRRYVLEHQGATRIVHQPDGSIICEPLGYPPAGTRAHSKAGSVAGTTAGEEDSMQHYWRLLGVRNLDELRGRLVSSALFLGQVTMFAGAVCGLYVGVFEVDKAMSLGVKVEPGKVVRQVNQIVSGCVVGALAGAVAVPAMTLLGLLRMAVRPVLLGAAVHGVVSWAARHRMGAVAILKKLQSGELSSQLEALRRLVSRLEASAPFCAQFKRLAGVDALLKLLAEWLDAAERGSNILGSPRAALLTRALDGLSKQGDAVDTMVELGGVPILLRAVSYSLCSCSLPGAGTAAAPPSSAPSLASSLMVMGRSGLLAPTPSAALGGGTQLGGEGPSCAGLLLHATAALARVASGHAVAQQQLASEPGAAQLVVSVLEASTARNLRGATGEACDVLRGHAVALAQALALEPVGKAALGQAGGVEALAAALLLSSPWTQGQETAAAALHTLVRGDVDNQRRLSNVASAGLSAALHRALATSPSGSSSNASSNAGGSGVVGGGAMGGGMMQPSCSSPHASGAGVGGQGAAVGQGGCGQGGRPVSPQDCHWHKADLLALSNVIARFAQPPAPLARISSGSTASPPNGVQTPPLATTTTAAAAPAPSAAAVAHPVPTLAQRLGLRRAPSAAPKAAPTAAAEPRPSLDEPSAAAAVAAAVATALPMPAPVSTVAVAAAPVDAAAGVQMLALGAPVEGGAALLGTPTAGQGVKVTAAVPGTPESDDWEQDCGLPVEAKEQEGDLLPSLV